MGTPKLWSKNTMGQRGNFIRDPTRSDNKKDANVMRKFIYYGQAVDPTLLVALGSITAEK